MVTSCLVSLLELDRSAATSTPPGVCSIPEMWPTSVAIPVDGDDELARTRA